MSGICGFFGKEDLSLLKNMFNQINPTGGTFIPISRKNICFCGNSLNTSDKSVKGNLIFNEDESIFLSFDGEIYNYKRLHDELVSSGHIFNSDYKLEVLVHLYEEMGPDSVEKLNGAFSAVLWDETRKKLYLFVDKFGIKQLYYSVCDDVFLFGSAIKSIIQFPNFKRELDEIVLNHFLTLEFSPTERTLIKGIFRLLPAHLLVYERGEVKKTQYWDFSINVSNKNEEFYVKNLRRLLEDSVRKRIDDSESIGALLSGGMDSSAVVALLRNVTDKPIKTFSVHLGEESSLKEPDWKYARLVAEYYDTDHNEMILDDTILDGLPYFIWASEDPNTSLVPLLMREFVKKQVDVVFTGRGSDEIFGGQSRFAGIQYIHFAGQMHKYIPTVIPALFSEIIERPRDLFTKYKPEWDNYLRYMNIFSSFGKKSFFYGSIIPGYVRNDKRILYSTELSHVREEDTNELFCQYFSKNGDFFNEMLRAEAKTRLSAVLVNIDNKISNIIGLVERAPLVDPDVVTFSFTIPSQLKVKNHCRKYIFRKAMSDILPKEIIQRKKGGGFMPKAYALFVKTSLRDRILSSLPYWNLIKKGYIREDYINNILSRPISPNLNRQYSLILYLLSLELWYNIFIEPKSVCQPESDVLEKYLGSN